MKEEFQIGKEGYGADQSEGIKQTSTPRRKENDKCKASSTCHCTPVRSGSTEINMQHIFDQQNKILSQQQETFVRLGEILHRVSLNEESLLTSTILY